MVSVLEIFDRHSEFVSALLHQAARVPVKRAHDNKIWIAIGTVTIVIFVMFLLCCFLRLRYPRRGSGTFISGTQQSPSLSNSSSTAAIPTPPATIPAPPQHQNSDNCQVRDDICPVCREDIGEEPTSAAPCNHVLHIRCWQTWLTKDATLRCPVCRGHIFRNNREPRSSYRLASTLSYFNTSLTSSSEQLPTTISNNLHSVESTDTPSNGHSAPSLNSDGLESLKRQD